MMSLYTWEYYQAMWEQELSAWPSLSQERVCIDVSGPHHETLARQSANIKHVSSLILAAAAG